MAIMTVAVASIAACGFFPFSRMSRSGADPLVHAPKPAPVDSALGSCGPEGSQPDYALNRLKNRVDTATYVATRWKVIARLPWPRQVGYRLRNQWTGNERAKVSKYEGAPISLEGYVIGYRLEGREPPNCYSNEPPDRDFHIWLAERPGEQRKHSIVVEITPRVRASHPGWTAAALDSLVRSRARVRVSGWLMLDQMHPELVGGNRVTLWEVHPIMRMEVMAADSTWKTVGP